MVPSLSLAAPAVAPALASLLSADIASAGLASLAVTPFVASVDKAIVMLASGQVKSVGASVTMSLMSMLQSPQAFMMKPEFIAVFVVYFLTYVSANCASTICNDVLSTSDTIPKLFSTTVTNVVSCITKDVILAKLYGSTGGVVPLITILLFSVRDLMTIAASFTLPPKVSRQLQRSPGLPPSVAENFAQLSCPVIVQVFSTPIHLLGLSLYNSPTLDFAQRIASMRTTYQSALNGRMGRILPAFGLGGVGNRVLRDGMRRRATDRAVRKAAIRAVAAAAAQQKKQ
jgi:hypothetical protein